MKKIFNNMKIKTQIILIYISVLVVTFTVILMINQWYTEKEIGNVGEQTISALAGNLSFIFENITQFSSLIYFDSDIQESLKKIDSVDINSNIQQRIQQSLSNIILSGDYISSTFIFDKYFNNYSAYKVGPILVNKEKIKSSIWYERMKRSGGNGFFIHKSEEVLSFPTRIDKNYISYIREIGNSNTYEPIATLLITIDTESIEKYFKEIGDDFNSQFFIARNNGEYIIPPSKDFEYYDDYVQSTDNLIGSDSKYIKNDKFIIIGKELGINDWILVGSFEIDGFGASTPYGITVLSIIYLNMLVVMICGIWLSKLIFYPLTKIGNQMMLVEKGEFHKLEISNPENNNEINTLKKVFNHMTTSIQDLIYTVKLEEQNIAKIEMNLIYAQINPHFLYNTLDAVSALALMEDHENCFKMTQALGSFYRNSLNSGLDFISVKDEIQGINSYMTILNTRYDNKIKIEYDIEEDVEEMKVLKLLLQPIVENAVHHGIKEKGGEGSIHIRIYRDEDEIIFSITDDGCGIKEERIKEILEGRVKTGKSGFGVYSLIQRIKLYYNIDNPISIYSELDIGTEITIRVGVIN